MIPNLWWTSQSHLVLSGGIIFRDSKESSSLGRPAFRFEVDNRKCPDELVFDEFVQAIDNIFQMEPSAFMSARIDSKEHAWIDRLQSEDFLVVEFSLHPYRDLSDLECSNESPIDVSLATSRDLRVLRLAETGFRISRIHRDSRIEPHIANSRFRNWTMEALDPGDPREVLIFTHDTEGFCGFFVTSTIGKLKRWDLTVLEPHLQGKGLAKNVWHSAMCHARSTGFTKIETTISGENLQVVGLYPSLGFHFEKSSYVLHRLESRARSIGT